MDFLLTREESRDLAPPFLSSLTLRLGSGFERVEDCDIWRSGHGVDSCPRVVKVMRCLLYQKAHVIVRTSIFHRWICGAVTSHPQSSDLAHFEIVPQAPL
jgi:hypothetical protein